MRIKSDHNCISRIKNLKFSITKTGLIIFGAIFIFLGISLGRYQTSFAQTEDSADPSDSVINPNISSGYNYLFSNPSMTPEQLETYLEFENQDFSTEKGNGCCEMQVLQQGTIPASGVGGGSAYNFINSNHKSKNYFANLVNIESAFAQNSSSNGSSDTIDFGNNCNSSYYDQYGTVCGTQSAAGYASGVAGASCGQMTDGRSGCEPSCDTANGWRETSDAGGDFDCEGEVQIVAINCHLSSNCNNSRECENSIYCYKCEEEEAPPEENPEGVCDRMKDVDCSDCDPNPYYDNSCAGGNCNKHALPNYWCFGGALGNCPTCSPLYYYQCPQNCPDDPNVGEEPFPSYWSAELGAPSMAYTTHSFPDPRDKLWQSYYIPQARNCGYCSCSTCCNSFTTEDGTEYQQCWCCSCSCGTTTIYIPESNNKQDVQCYRPLTCSEIYGGSYRGSEWRYFTVGNPGAEVGSTDDGVCNFPAKVVGSGIKTVDGWCNECVICDNPSCNPTIRITSSNISPLGCSGDADPTYDVPIDGGEPVNTTFTLSLLNSSLWGGGASVTFPWDAQTTTLPLSFSDYENLSFEMKLTPTTYLGTMDLNFTKEYDPVYGEVCTARWWNYENEYSNTAGAKYIRAGESDNYGMAEQNGRWLFTHFNASLNGYANNNSLNCSIQSNCTIKCEESIGSTDVEATSCGATEWVFDLGLQFIPDTRVLLAYDGPGDANDESGLRYSSGCVDCDDTLGKIITFPYTQGHQRVNRVVDSALNAVSYSNVFGDAVKAFPQGVWSSLFYTDLAGNKGSSYTAQNPVPMPSNPNTGDLLISNLYAIYSNKPGTLTYDVQLNNSGLGSEGYWSCVCPEGVSDGAGNTNCTLEYTPTAPDGRDKCITKRTYISYVPCTNTSWFQVSGGNIYGQSGIYDNVPLNSQTECGGLDLCIDNSQEGAKYFQGAINTNSSSTGKYYETYSTTTNNDAVCTPRIIRGMTACKPDGESNSSGIALTSNTVWGQSYDNILANATPTTPHHFAPEGTGGYFSNSTNNYFPLEILSHRISERASIHALDPNGIVQPPAGAEVGGVYNPASNDSNSETKRPGFQPRNENWDYFVSLVGGEEKLLTEYNKNYRAENIAHNKGLQSSELNNWCTELTAENDLDRQNSEADPNQTDIRNYICYVGENLTLDREHNDIWQLKSVFNEEGELSHHQRVTIFVDGDLHIGNNDIDINLIERIQASQTDEAVYNSEDDEALITVDVDNFLAFIVHGDIIIGADAGINMPIPRVDADRVEEICWEGQNAAIPSTTYVVGDNAKKVGRGVLYNSDRPSSTGVIEGIYIADGKIKIQSYHYQYNNKEHLYSDAENKIFSIDCKNDIPDKRFISQGSLIGWGGVELDRSFDFYTDNYQNQCASYIQGEYGTISLPDRTANQLGTGGINQIGLYMSSYNNRVPAETFIYRPDLIRNTPAWMQNSLINIETY